MPVLLAQSGRAYLSCADTLVICADTGHVRGHVADMRRHAGHMCIQGYPEILIHCINIFLLILIKLYYFNYCTQRKDLLQLMLNADTMDAHGKKVGKLTEEEVVGQSLTFILAGYETTSNALAYTTYCLAMNPDKQEKLLEEIDQTIKDGVSAAVKVFVNVATTTCIGDV